MQNNLIKFIELKTRIKFVYYPSVLKLVSVYVTAFVVVLALLNGPLIISLITYPFTHSEEADNERLTAQYIALYGYHAQERAKQAAQSLSIAKAAILITNTPLPVAKAVAPVYTPSAPVAVNSLITIPKINITAPIILVSSENENVILKSLKNGVVLYPGSALPGQSGSTIIVGHSSSNPPWTKYSAIFSLLNKLAPDDLIDISFGGKKYTYQVKAIEKGSVQHILDSGLGGDLILTSCWPVGTDQGRIVVVANLVN